MEHRQFADIADTLEAGVEFLGAMAEAAGRFDELVDRVLESETFREALGEG